MVTPLLQQLVTWPTSSGARETPPPSARRQSGQPIIIKTEETRCLSVIVRQADITSLILVQTSRSFLPPPLTDNIVQQLNPLLQQMTPESQPGARGTLLSILAPAPSLNPFTSQMYANLFWAANFLVSNNLAVDLRGRRLIDLFSYTIIPTTATLGSHKLGIHRVRTDDNDLASILNEFPELLVPRFHGSDENLYGVAI